MFILSEEILILLILTIPFALEDIIRRSVPLWMFAALFAAGIIYASLNGAVLKNVALSLIPGTIMLLLSFILKGQIGTGDAIYFISAAPFLGLRHITALIMISMLLAAAVSLVMILKGKRGTLPFLVFVPVSLLIMITQRGGL